MISSEEFAELKADMSGQLIDKVQGSKEYNEMKSKKGADLRIDDASQRKKRTLKDSENKHTGARRSRRDR